MSTLSPVRSSIDQVWSGYMPVQSSGSRDEPGCSFVRGLSRTVTVTAVAVSLAASGIPFAGAQSGGQGSVDPGSLVPSVGPGSLYGTPSLSLAFVHSDRRSHSSHVGARLGGRYRFH